MTQPAAILIGPPGAGKSTVGPLLAGRLGVGFVDTDDRIEAVAGKPVGDIFVEDGEPAFRELEREAVAQAIAAQDGVIALGSGAVLDPGTRRLLAGQQVVYLKTGFAAVARGTESTSRDPPLPGNPRARLRALLDDRAPLYAGTGRDLRRHRRAGPASRSPRRSLLRWLRARAGMRRRGRRNEHDPDPCQR